MTGSRSLALLVAIAAAAGSAHADRADRLFKKGKRQLADKRYADACATFEKVDDLDPGIGAKLNVAKCYEEWGKLARAYRWYADAQKMANTTNDKRAPKIKELIDTLDADVPRLTVKLPEGIEPASVIVKLDGRRLAPDLIGKEQRVDPGKHVLEYTATGGKKTKNVPLERGGTAEVTLDVAKPPDGTRLPDPKETKDPAEPEPGGTEPTPAPKPVTPAVATPGRGRKIAGVVIASAGLVGLGAAGYLTLDARGTYKDALAAHCNNASDMCSDEGVRITGEARSRANVATAISIASALAIAGGVLLYVTAPDRESATGQALYIAPAVEQGGGGIVFGGGF